MELTGITFLDKRMKLRVNPTSAMELDNADEGDPQAETMQLLVQDVLMAIDMPESNKPLFHLVDETTGGSHEGFYPENADREQMDLQHTASLVMTHLIWE